MPLATLRRRPYVDLVGIGDITGLAVHAIFVMDEELPRSGLFGILHHLVDGRVAQA